MKRSVKKELCFFSLFEKFIQDSQKGRRLQPNGKRLSSGSITYYTDTLRLLRDFSLKRKFSMRICPLRRLSNREVEREKNYWKKFYKRFSDYLYDECGCFDNYVGQCMKNIKVFFNYLNKDLALATGDFHRQLYVRKEEVPIFPLMPEELNYLIFDKAFEAWLSPRLKEAKDLFVFGCTVASRVSDLIQLKKSNVRVVGSQYYLAVRSQKTATDSLIKLPSYAVDIVLRYSRAKKWLLPRFNKEVLNKYIKKLLELAGFTQVVCIQRERRGKAVELKNHRATNRMYRFCDIASSHTMRRTAITTMLSLGMTEQVVRRISGHSPHSKEFYRYVLWAQTYQDRETE